MLIVTQKVKTFVKIFDKDDRGIIFKRKIFRISVK